MDIWLNYSKGKIKIYFAAVKTLELNKHLFLNVMKIFLHKFQQLRIYCFAALHPRKFGSKLSFI